MSPVPLPHEFATLQSAFVKGGMPATKILIGYDSAATLSIIEQDVPPRLVARTNGKR